MNKPLFPRRPPADIAAELFDSCAWEAAGDALGASHKAAYYLFQELIQRIGASDQRCNELSRQIAVDPEGPGADGLRDQMHDRAIRVGTSRAKYVFRHFGKLPSTTDINDRKNYAVLDRLDWMKDENGDLCPNYLRLAKQLAPENQALPLAERKGPGGVDVPALAKHIENLAKKRERELANGTWFGPITHEQAVRYFGAKDVATISKK